MCPQGPARVGEHGAEGTGEFASRRREFQRASWRAGREGWRQGSDCRWQLGRKSFLYGDEVQQFGGKHLIEQALMARCSEKRPHQALSGSEGDLGDD